MASPTPSIGDGIVEGHRIFERPCTWRYREGGFSNSTMTVEIRKRSISIHHPSWSIEDAIALQVSPRGRPKIADAGAADPLEAPAAKARTVENFTVVHLRFKDALGKVVPALLCRPKGKTGP